MLYSQDTVLNVNVYLAGKNFECGAHFSSFIAGSDNEKLRMTIG